MTLNGDEPAGIRSSKWASLFFKGVKYANPEFVRIGFDVDIYRHFLNPCSLTSATFQRFPDDLKVYCKNAFCNLTDFLSFLQPLIDGTEVVTSIVTECRTVTNHVKT